LRFECLESRSLLATLPGAFEITGPEHHHFGNNVTIAWEESPGATNYELLISHETDLSDPFIVETVVGTSREFILGAGVPFFVGVIAKNDDGETAASNQPYRIDIVLLDFVQTIFVSSQELGIDFANRFPPLPQLFGSAGAADFHGTFLANQAGLLEDWDQQTSFFKAMITGTFLDLDIRAQIADGHFLNVKGQVVAHNSDELYFGPHHAPILDEHGQVVAGVNVPIWTGSTANGGWSGLTADDWTNPFSSGATVGNLNGVDSGTFLDNGTRAAHLGAHLVFIGVRQTPLPTGLLSVEQSVVTVAEGTIAHNSGTFGGTGMDRRLEASVGTVVDNGDGTWSWSFDAADGPDDSEIVRINAIDSESAQEITFILAADNAPPSARIDDAPTTVNVGETFAFSGTFTDPGTRDTHTQTWSVATSGQVIASGAGPNFNFTPSARGVYTVTYKVADNDAGVGTDTLILTVISAETNAPPTADAGAPYTVIEGRTPAFYLGAYPGTLLGSGTDPDGDPLTYEWDFDYDGSTFNVDATGATSILSAANLDGPSTLTVALRVTDDGGLSAIDTATVNVLNSAPSASLIAIPPAQEGDTVLVTVDTVSETSAADRAAGFRYSYDFNNDGTLEIVDSPSNQAQVPSEFVADGPAEHLVRVWIKDKDGGQTGAGWTLVVNNAPPTASMAGPSQALVGQPLTFILGTADPSPIDQNATADVPNSGQFTYRIDWDGDDTFDEMVVGPTGEQITHSFATASGPGGYPVRVTARDKDGGTSAVATIGQAVVVDAPTPATLTQAIATLPAPPAGSEATLLIEVTTSGQAAELLAAINGLAAPSDPVTIHIELAPGSYAGLTANPPAGVTLIIEGDGGTTVIQGASPALVVGSGMVVVSGLTLENSTDASTILVTGGSLTLRDSSVAETSGGTRAAIEIFGGSVDLGTAADPGGNSLNVIGSGELIRNLSANVMTALGNTLLVDGVPLVSGFRIEDEVFHTLDAGGGGRVIAEEGHVYVTASSGSIQRGIDAVEAGGMVHIEGTALADFAAGTKPLTIDFDGGTRFDQGPDALDAGTQSLTVTGTAASDLVYFAPAAPGQVKAWAIGYPAATFAPTGRIIAHGEAGNDAIIVDPRIMLPAWLYGGAGNDLLTGGGGNDVLLGGDGVDALAGLGGRNLLIGGAGGDGLVGGLADDLLIAGITAHDGDETALSAVMAEWTSTRSYENRVSNLRGVTTGATFGSRLNGDNFLNVDAARGAVTVFDDAAVDLLTGLAGRDWFFADLDNADPTKRDLILALAANESRDDVD
jgi:hypothetical protein